MTYCFVCYDAGEIECPSCRGSGRKGGILGFGARQCPMCSGSGAIPCDECDETRDYLLKPEEEKPLVQLELGIEGPRRPAIVPVPPPFEVVSVDWESVEGAPDLGTAEASTSADHHHRRGSG